jgi:hypothetical protein
MSGDEADSHWRCLRRCGSGTGWNSGGDGHGLCVCLCGNLRRGRDCCRVDCCSRVDEISGHVAGDSRPYCGRPVSQLNQPFMILASRHLKISGVDLRSRRCRCDGANSRIKSRAVRRRRSRILSIRKALVQTVVSARASLGELQRSRSHAGNEAKRANNDPVHHLGNPRLKKAKV